MSQRRALGQHFLRDPGIARAIVDLVAPTARDLVVEIGPGEGALTDELARRAGRVIALEVDRGLIERLRRRLPAVDVLEADARTWDYGRLTRPEGGRVLVVGNLPYSVGKPIVAALMDARRVLDAMALMLQREVAERLAAPPGGKVYGALSVLTQTVCDVELALRVPPGAFRPPPKVDSAVVWLAPRRQARVPPRSRPDSARSCGRRSHAGARRWRMRWPVGLVFHWGWCGRRPPDLGWTPGGAPRR